ncbi:putative ATP-dependent RNA helicase DHX57 [Nomia melanderi]|uniref:putative ATP-dependent RNA helicase DHX57 n=1 Tax=Nomia melanderi TaxID=2448451 RepID=UPI00130471BE|nr:putative ATP-dependent RNA helicase DHX57 [Nomia melanderi]XP_031831070.1 putative ATP-dependent RNA helicase DHX57 [Nomia melanderi]XP_031831071.1 putative ATP-dependent RNA helicase DHX57 [Nomia melanderi]
MDHNSIQLMEDVTLDGKSNGKNITNVLNKNKCKNENPCISSKLKVELQMLRISEESERQLYDTLKHIYGPSFKLSDISEFENKKSNLDKQYWVERGNLVIKGIVDYSSKDITPKTEEQITRQFAIAKLESYGFHQSHCIEALIHTEGDMGKALEILFFKYYNVENLKNKVSNGVDTTDFLERRQDEKEALESIYENMFIEKIKNQIWTVQVNLEYLVRNDEVEQEIRKIKLQQEKAKEKEVCRLFIHKKCRFGNKCRFLHQQPQVLKIPEREDPQFTLEIRFPEGCKYPYEPPFFYFYKNNGTFSSIHCLRISRRLYNEALSLAEDGVPSIFSIISLLQNEYDMKTYLAENREQFLDQNDLLFPKLLETEDENRATHHELGSINRRNRNKITSEEILKTNDLIRENFKEKQENHKYKRMKEIRRKLPAWSKMDNILETIHEHQVTIISGETGCGKSTQVPQFLLDDWMLNKSKSKEHINIICTQPRRISAVGVAERVASERDERVGDTVGYQIRLESKMSNKTRLTFCTTGILLQRFSMNPELTDVTHVIVDEVHERSAESDFLLMLLKELLCKRSNLKIILMSATLKAEAFSSYFREAPILYIPGKTFPVEQIFLEDIFEWTNYILEENSKFTRKIRGDWEQLQIDLETAEVEGVSAAAVRESIQDENLTLMQIVSRYHDYSKQTHKNLYVMDHDKINFDLIETILEWIAFGSHDYPRTGSILVFLPGFAEIITLKNQLNDNKNLSPRTGKFIVVPLHSSLSSEEQNLVFKKTGDIRKIVLSTNLAETSITIDDCVFVIDSGKMKETRFNSNQNMESLETCWVSQANALQRKGRAGRVMAGVCIHLYTSYKFKYHFSAQPVPEILRIPLEPLLLRIQILHKGMEIDSHKVLDKLLEPPSVSNVHSAIKRLQDVGAFNSECTLTPLGHHLAALPVDVRIGKLILFGAIFCCLDSALTIAACLSHKTPFTVPFERRHEVDAKKEFCTANSDHLTVLKVYKKWLEACAHSNIAGQVFANENYLSVRTLCTLADIKYQFLELLVSIGFVPTNLPKRQPNVDRVLEITGFELNVNNDNYKLLQGLICAALYPNVVKVFTPEKSFQVQSAGAIPMQPKPEELKFQTKCDGFVSIHPSSVNFHVGYFPSPYLVFQEKIKTSKVFIKEVTMVPILLLILFSGYDLNIELHNGLSIVSLEDGWILFSVESHKVGQLLQRMRKELVKLLEEKMKDPLLNLLNHQNGRKIIQTIVHVVTKD